MPYLDETGLNYYDTELKKFIDSGLSKSLKDAKDYTDTRANNLESSLRQDFAAADNVVRNEFGRADTQIRNDFTEADTELLNTIRKGIVPKKAVDIKLNDTLYLGPNRYYVLIDNNSRSSPIVLGLVEPTEPSIVSEYRFRITIASSNNSTFSISEVKGLPSELVKGYTYEVSIVDNFATYQVWEA